jgi:hypothetical protein
VLGVLLVCADCWLVDWDWILGAQGLLEFTFRRVFGVRGLGERGEALLPWKTFEFSTAFGLWLQDSLYFRDEKQGDTG